MQAGRDFGVKVMGDNLAAGDRVGCARWMESLGVDFIIHHIGYDERRMITGLSPMDEIDEVVRAVSIPVQAVTVLAQNARRQLPQTGSALPLVGLLGLAALLGGGASWYRRTART